MRPRSIVAIYDTLADDLATMLVLHANDTTAVRWFGDVMNHPESQLRRHVADYHLIEIGIIDDMVRMVRSNQEHHGQPYRIILTGEQWLAMESAAQEAAANG